MKYRTRPGIILTEIGGKELLVCAGALRNEMPYVTEINETASECWKLLNEGNDEEEIIDHFQKEYKEADSTMIKADLERLFQELNDKGYIERIE
jgi:hypothetical protein